MTARQQRAARGVAVSLLATLLAATAHTLGGGGAPSPWLVAAVALLSSPVGVALVGRRMSGLRTTLAVAAAQVVFHTAFALSPAGSPVSQPAAHLYHHHFWGALPVFPPAPSQAVPPVSSLSLPMLTLHLAAAVVTAVALHRGERLLRTVARGLRRLLPSLVDTPPHPPVVRRVPAVGAARVPFRLRHLAALPRRGPPAPVPVR